MRALSSSQKGGLAEAEIAAAALRLGLVVLRPIGDGGRYDLAFDTGSRSLRVQCKWISRRGEVLTARCLTSRRTSAGHRHTSCTATEIDAIPAYAPETDSCCLIPSEEVDRRATLSLRLGPTLNNQAHGVRWARDYEIERAIARIDSAGGCAA
jgi:hypothetical protein